MYQGCQSKKTDAFFLPKPSKCKCAQSTSHTSRYQSRGRLRRRTSAMLVVLLLRITSDLPYAALSWKRVIPVHVVSLEKIRGPGISAVFFNLSDVTSSSFALSWWCSVTAASDSQSIIICSYLPPTIRPIRPHRQLPIHLSQPLIKNIEIRFLQPI